MDWQALHTAHGLLESNAGDWPREQGALWATIGRLADMRRRVEAQMSSLRNRPEDEGDVHQRTWALAADGSWHSWQTPEQAKTV